MSHACVIETGSTCACLNHALTLCICAQIALSETQQQLAQQKRSDINSASELERPSHPNSISPQKLSALQQSMQDLHAEVAELRSTLYQKDAELEMLHRSALCLVPSNAFRK